MTDDKLRNALWAACAYLLFSDEPPSDEMRSKIMELGDRAGLSGIDQWGGEAEAIVRSALSEDADLDYSPAYQDEYQRLYHQAAKQRDFERQRIEELGEALREIKDYVFVQHALFDDIEHIQTVAAAALSPTPRD